MNDTQCTIKMNAKWMKGKQEQRLWRYGRCGRTKPEWMITFADTSTVASNRPIHCPASYCLLPLKTRICAQREFSKSIFTCFSCPQSQHNKSKHTWTLTDHHRLCVCECSFVRCRIEWNTFRSHTQSMWLMSQRVYLFSSTHRWPHIGWRSIPGQLSGGCFVFVCSNRTSMLHRLLLLILRLFMS